MIPLLLAENDQHWLFGHRAHAPVRPLDSAVIDRGTVKRSGQDSVGLAAAGTTTHADIDRLRWQGFWLWHNDWSFLVR